MSPLAQALAMASDGIPCFPCRAGNKAPACPGGFTAATTDPAVLRALWERHEGPLIGVPTGTASGLDALDIDPRHGGDVWERAHADRLPPTRMHATRSGGRHYLFRNHQGVRNSADKIAPGIDVRGDGGYVIWWPADARPVVHDAPLAPWPEWLLLLILPKPKPARQAPAPVLLAGATHAGRYVEAALRNAIVRVAAANEGRRNDTLNRETFALARFAREGVLTPSAIAQSMAAAGLAAGLTEREVAATIASALADGMAQ